MIRNLLAVVLAVLVGGAVAFASCSAPQNPIEAENCQPGSPSSQWDVGINNGDLNLVGFATDISVNAGQTINFKIRSSYSSYQMNIYRMGYYGGMGARLITSIQPSVQLPQTQPACLTDSTTNLIDCGNWGVTASWQVPTTVTSGIYFVHLVASNGGNNHIVFIVRNDASHSDLLFQTSDETWQAYNEWGPGITQGQPSGGHSLYGPTGAFDITNRAYKVSYNRPFHTRDFEDEALSFMFGPEYAMVRWLEANGYDVSYFTGVDAARNGSLILNHKVYLSVGHDEYWSGPHRANVEAARAAGIHLAFFSGNEVFWKTRWENSTDGSNTPYRTLACYKETYANAVIDPQDPPTWTGTWRDPRFSPPGDGGRPENALNGTIFMVNGPGSDNTNLSIKVPQADGQMRFWRNTTIADLSPGQTATLPAGTLGYEWDEDLDNGFRPAGTFDLSTATYTMTSDLLLDYGETYGAGTAVHHMTMYRAASGALVFGAGTAQWPFGLDGTHDNPLGASTTPDPDMQQATVNLLADMGAQPVTLQGGLLLATRSNDTTPPASTITFPTNGATVPTGTAITITGTASDSGGGVVGGVEVSLDGGATWHPASGRGSWTYSWTASVPGNYTVQSRATDDSGNIETTGPTIPFIAENNAQSLVSIMLNPTVIVGGNTVQGTITLGQPAAPGSAVTLSSSNPSAASVPNSVTVPPRNITTNFTVSTSTVLASTQVTITGIFITQQTANLTVKPILPPPQGTLAIDAVVSADQGTAATSVTSSAFSTAVGNELVLAFLATDALSPGITVTGVSGAGLNWNLVVRTNTQLGTSEIWRALAPTALNNVSVTANLSQKVVSSITVMTFAGVDTSGTNGSGAVGAVASANASSGAPSVSLTTTRNNSWVLGVGNDWDSATGRTVPSNQTMVHQDLSPTGDTYWVQQQSAPTSTSGTLVKINDTAPTGDRYNLSAVEVLPANGPTYAVSGSITPGSLGSGATITLLQGTNMIATVTADTSGNFTFSSVQNGTYTVTPSKNLVSFTPTSQTVTVNGGNVTGVTFTATSQSWSVSGMITPPIAGITVNLTGASSASTTTDGSGNYTFSSLGNGNYTITPTQAGYAFSPNSQNVTINGANVSGVTFTATQVWSISGTITPATAGLTVNLSGTSSGSTTTNASGNYTFGGLANGNYTITPSQAGYTFTPSSKNVAINGANVTGVNFTATIQTWSISGTVTPATAGITVDLTGTSTGSTTSDTSGNYSFIGLTNGSYTITPKHSGYTFTPTFLNVGVNGANVTGQNFTWQSSGTGIAIDANISKDGASANTTIATPTFSTTSGSELLLAFIATDYISGTNTKVNSITGGGLTWTLSKRTNTQSGTAEIWWAFSSATLSNVTVTATLSQRVVASITLLSYTGVDTSGGGSGAIGTTGSGNAKTGAPTASLVTTRNNSWVFGVGNDYDNAIGRTLGSGQTLVHQFLTPSGDTYWVQMQNSPTPLSGTGVTINDTAPTGDRYNLTIVEVRTP